jgi:ubiquinone/menaquinone biosynthesis C-methylase UbiE
MIAFLHKRALAFARTVLKKLTDKELLEVLVDAAKTRAESLPPAEGLKFLFSLDASLYPVQGWLSVAYDGGMHTKHRHTRYHDFFVNRIATGERVLDVGCGIGALAYDVAAKAGAHVVGMDLVAQNIVTAAGKHSHPHVAYLVGDVLRSPLKGRFDTVVLSNVVEHLEQRPEFLRGVVRAVQPARLLVRVPVFERDWRVPLKKELGIDYRLDPTHFTEYTLESFAAEMDEAGLNVTHQEVRWGEIWAEAAPT